MAQEPINFYGKDNPYGQFSNCYPSSIELDGFTWSTTEHYFQAQKFVSDEKHFQNVLQALKP